MIVDGSGSRALEVSMLAETTVTGVAMTTLRQLQAADAIEQSMELRLSALLTRVVGRLFGP